MQNFTALGRLGRLKVTKMWQNRVLRLDPGLNSPKFLIYRSAQTLLRWKVICLIAADMGKDFDSIDHNFIVAALEVYAFRPDIVQ